MTSENIDSTKMFQNIAVSLSDQSFIRPICLQEQIRFELSFKSNQGTDSLEHKRQLLSLCLRAKSPWCLGEAKEARQLDQEDSGLQDFYRKIPSIPESLLGMPPDRRFKKEVSSAEKSQGEKTENNYESLAPRMAVSVAPRGGFGKSRHGKTGRALQVVGLGVAKEVTMVRVNSRVPDRLATRGR